MATPSGHITHTHSSYLSSSNYHNDDDEDDEKQSTSKAATGRPSKNEFHISYKRTLIKRTTINLILETETTPQQIKEVSLREERSLFVDDLKLN